MPITCSNCGKVYHIMTGPSCSVCGAALPVTQGQQSLSKHQSSNLSSQVFLPALIGSNGVQYALILNSETTIGSQNCTITLQNTGIVPRHARIMTSNSHCWIESLGGSVQVNGTLVTKLTLLRELDRITIGSVTLVFQLGGKNQQSIVTTTVKSQQSKIGRAHV